MVLLRSIQIAFSAFRKHWLELLCISARISLHSHLLHYSKTLIVYLLNGVYASNWQPLRIRHYTLASHLTLLAELLRLHEPVRTLRSSSSLLLSVPRCNLEFGSRAFRIFAPKIWNSLPANIRDSPSLPTFRRHLKTLYF